MTHHLSPKFSIKSFTIHTVEGASCVNIGNNEPSGFRSYKKHNQGFGSVTGNHNDFDGLKTLLHDNALLDFLSGVEQEDLEWFKEMVTAKVIENLENDDESDWKESLDDPYFDTDLIETDEVEPYNLLDDTFDELVGDD